MKADEKQFYTREGRKFVKVEPEKNRKAEPQLPGRIFGSVLETQRSIIKAISGILLNSDIAYRRDRNLQRMMRNDPDVMSPLLQRQYAVGLLEWDVVPEDKSDEKQKSQAEDLKSLIEQNMRRWHDFIRVLMDAVWYGPSAVNVIYDRVEGGTAPVLWTPFHPDSLVYTETGQLGLMVGHQYKGDSVQAWNGRARLFSDIERRAVVSHVYMPTGPDYEEPYEARYAHAGRGLRDVVWFQWLMKQTALQLWMAYVERNAMGNRVGRYPFGNQDAQDAIETALDNLVGDVSVSIPVDPNAPDAYGIDILNMPQGSEKTIVDLIEGYLAGQIKELIIGQTATTEATATGLGSDVGTRHAETFGRIIKFDAYAMADTLSFELIQPLHVMNFGETPYKPRFEFNVEDVDSHEFMEGVKNFVDMGGRVPMRQVRGRLGIDEPEEGEECLERQEEMGFGATFGDEEYSFARVRGAVTRN